MVEGISNAPLTFIKPYDAAEREEIYIEAHRLFGEYHRRTFVRGQAFREEDGIEYWVHISTMNRLREDMNKDVQSS